MLAELAFYSSILGSFLVILPTFEIVERTLTNTEKLKNLESGRRILLNFESIHKSDAEYRDILDVIVKRNDKIIKTLIVYELHPSRFGGYKGFGGKVYALDRKQAGSDNPFDVYEDENPELIDSILIVDEWISKEIRELRNGPKQKVRTFGFSLIVISVIIQAYLLTTHGSIIGIW